MCISKGAAHRHTSAECVSGGRRPLEAASNPVSTSRLRVGGEEKVAVVSKNAGAKSIGEAAQELTRAPSLSRQLFSPPTCPPVAPCVCYVNGERGERDTHTNTHTHREIMCQVSLWIEVTVTVEVMECSRDQ